MDPLALPAEKAEELRRLAGRQDDVVFAQDKARAAGEDVEPLVPLVHLRVRRYRSQSKVWSGNPNPQLVELAAGLTAGTALVVGSGEGADAIWLAERGWQVTAADISAVAVERAGVRAAEIGAAVAGRIDWVREDLAAWTPEPASYDLVSAQFMHLPKDPRETMFRGLAAAVAPGGCLLIVGHDPSDMQTTMPRPPMPELFFTAGEVADSLDPGAWEVLVCEARARPVADGDGRQVTIHDAVLLARRRS